MSKLTIQDIGSVLTERNGFDKREANRFVAAMFQVIQDGLHRDGLVKVKGLGTFKIIEVEARESVSVRTGERVVINGHSKISFVPDATMKELVNKPFSQFETVVLNDGVMFDDMKDGADSPEEPEAPVGADGPEVVDGPDVVDVPDVLETPIVVEIAEETETPVVQNSAEAPTPQHLVEIPIQPEPTAADQPEPTAIDQPEPTAADQPQPTDTSAVEEEQAGEEAPDGRSRSAVLPWVLGIGCLVLAALSALGGYWFGQQQVSAVVVTDTIVVSDTVYVAADDSVAMQLAEIENEHLQPNVEASQPAANTQPAAVDPTADPYAAKDVRIRLGAYRIVGVAREVKVLAGQTFSGICRAQLGPDMECYVEALNNLPRNPQIKEGQVIKIPKLQLKKARKRPK